MIVKLLTEHHLRFLSLKRGCTGSSESTLVKMPHFWKSHATAHLLRFIMKQMYKNGQELAQSHTADQPTAT